MGQQAQGLPQQEYAVEGYLLLCPVLTLPLQVIKLREGAHEVVRSTLDAVKGRLFLREWEAASGRAEKNHIAISAAIIALAPHTLLAFGNALHVGALAADLLSVTLTHQLSARKAKQAVDSVRREMGLGKVGCATLGLQLVGTHILTIRKVNPDMLRIGRTPSLSFPVRLRNAR